MFKSQNKLENNVDFNNLYSSKKMLDKKVHVYWKDDNCMYSGVINHYDQVSLRHRVQYDDGMWEFISLALEVVLFEDQF
jgi:hypothetical protein